MVSCKVWKMYFAICIVFLKQANGDSITALALWGRFRENAYRKEKMASHSETEIS